MKTAITTAVAITAMLMLAGATQSTSAAPASDDSNKPVIVKMGDDMKFSPAKITVKRGQMVAWQNLSHTIHNVVDVPSQGPKHMSLPAGAATFDSGLMNYGQTFVQTFTVPGTYKYACSLHIANRMFGEITVK